MNLLFSITTGLLSPHGVALHNNVLAVVDTGHHQLAVYDTNSPMNTPLARIGSLGTDPTSEGFLFPSAGAFVSANEMYVADTQNKHLDHFQLVGAGWTYQSSIWQFPGIAPTVEYIVDVAVDGNGNILFLDAINRRILLYNPAASTTSAYFSGPGWQNPTALTVGGGYVWVADGSRHKIYRYDQGFNQLEIGQYGSSPGQLRKPQGLAFETGSCNLYVSDSDNGRISVFDINGNFLEIHELHGVGSRDLHKLEVDSSGHLYVADAGSNAVHVLDTTQPSNRPSLSRRSIDFGYVGVGYRVSQPVSVINSSSVSIEVTGLVVEGSGFSLDSNTPVTPFSIAGNDERVLWVQFHPTIEGRVSGQLKVEASLPILQTLSATLGGEGLHTEPFALALVLDQSGSMSQSSGALSKMERLRIASHLLIDLISLNSANELAIIPFSSSASAAFPITQLSPSIALARNVIDSLQPTTTTSIGSGLEVALVELDKSSLVRKYVIVLSDGKENTSPYISDVQVPANLDIFTVGVGLPEFLNVETLETLATENQGYFQLTDGSDHLLAKFFVQIFSDIFGQQVILDPRTTIISGRTADIPFNLGAADTNIIVTFTWERSDQNYAIELLSPSGVTVTEDDFDWTTKGERYMAVRYGIQQTIDDDPGHWLVRIRAQNTRFGQQMAKNRMFLSVSNTLQRASMISRLFGSILDVGDVAIIASSGFNPSWDVGLIRKEAPSHRMLGQSGPEMSPMLIPPVHQYRALPRNIRTRDSVHFQLNPTQTLTGLRFERATLEILSPRRGLTTLLGRVERLDLDRTNQISFGVLMLIARITWQCLFGVISVVAGLWLISGEIAGSRILVLLGLILIGLGIVLIGACLQRHKKKKVAFDIYPDGSAHVSVPFDGPDGVYTCTAKAIAVDARGSRYQRERTYYFVVYK